MSQENLSQEQQKCIKTEPLNEKSYELMVKGRALNKGDKFNQIAFDLLTRSIKLNPNLTESWIELADCYQKKPDFHGAIICLERALKNSNQPNKLVLRNLSACMRQRPVDSQEAKIAALSKSLELSKQALRLDLEDANSYYNLAKAYMCLFFATECVDDTLIRMSRSAFEKVISLYERFGGGDNDSVRPLKEQSDFLFNYATVLIYMQEFQLAASLLENASRNEPEWDKPRELLESLHDYIRQINLNMNDLTKNVKKSTRRYKKVVDALENVSSIERSIIPDEQRLRQCSSIELKAISIKELINQKKANTSADKATVTTAGQAEAVCVSINILHIKLLFTINYNQAMYLTFIAIDKDYSFTVVTIHNLSAKNLPSNRDVVTLIEPKIDTMEVNLATKEQTPSPVCYHRINIRHFKEFYINGRRIALDQVAKPEMKLSMIADQEETSQKQ